MGGERERERLPRNVAGLYVTCLWRELIQSTVELRCEHAYGIALDYNMLVVDDLLLLLL